TERAHLAFEKQFGPGTRAFFVFNGTAANVLSLRALTQSYHSVLCSHLSHIQNDECGAPERFLGCKLLPVRTPDGKLTPEALEPVCRGAGDTHHVQPRVISITQSTEVGTVYRPEEIRALAAFARKRQL